MKNLSVCVRDASFRYCQGFRLGYQETFLRKTSVFEITGLNRDMY